MNQILPNAAFDVADKWLGEAVPDLDKIPAPDRYYLCVKQIQIQTKTASGIIIPDQTVDAQTWTHGLAIVLAVGPSSYKGRKMEDLGLSSEDAPQVGTIICFRCRGAPERFKVQGVEVMYIPDDAPYARPTPEQVPFISFKLN